MKFLVEQDFVNYLVDGDGSSANSDFTGYSLKEVMDYYNFFSMLLIVGDDAITWYGDNQNLTDEQFKVLYDVIFEKIFAVHEKMNDILIAFKENGTLPSKVQNSIESVEQLNSLMVGYGDKLKAFIEKYLGSSINVKFEDGSIAEEGKVVKMIDLLVGNDDPRVNIDTIYAIIYEYDETVQSKLKQLIESDKFKTAVEKFATTPFGEMFGGKDSLYDFFYLVAEEGIEAFKVPATTVTDIDTYKVEIGKVTITVKRAFE